MTRARLAIVASHPIQYQVPWFRALAQQTDLEVLYCHRQDAAGQAAAGFGQGFEWDIPLLDSYRYRWLTNVSKHPSVDTFSGCDTPAIGAVLRDGGFDACVVTGWYLKSFVQAIYACRRYDLPVLVRGDSQLKTPRSLVKRAFKYLPYRLALPQIDAHLYVGRANHAYLRHYGVEERRLFFVPHFVENDRFSAGAEQARADGRAAAVRSRLGLSSDDAVFLFAGKLIEKKRPQDFIAAIGQLNAEGITAHGLVIGSGPLEETLRQEARARGASIHFLGFHNQTAMPACYAAADCLVLPSDGGETWGLVINEAMACGLPAVVSDAVGGAADMIDEGQTGYRFPCGDRNALASRMRAFIDSRQNTAATFAPAVRARIAQYSCEQAVVGTMRALAFALASRAPLPSDKAMEDHA